MASMFTWTLTKGLLGTFLLLSCSIYPAFCNPDRDESVAAKTDEAGHLPGFVQGYLKNEKEAAASGFDFFSSEDYGQNWRDGEDPGLNDEDEIYYFPRILNAKTNSAVNLKLGYGSNFSNSGDVGSNMIYDVDDSRVNTREFSESRRTRNLNTAVNLKLERGSTFGNQGNIGSNIIRNFKERMKARNQSQIGTYSKQNYRKKISPWNLNTAVNLNLGPISTFGNEGNIGSNLIRNRMFYSLHEPKYYGIETPVLYSPLGPEQLYTQRASAYKDQDHIGSNVVENPRTRYMTHADSSYLNYGSRSTLGNKGNIGSNRIRKTKQQIRQSDNMNLRYPTNFRRQNTNAAANINSRYGTKFDNEGSIGSNLVYNTKSRNIYYPEMLLSTSPSLRSEKVNAAANTQTSYGTKIYNEGEMGSNALYNVAGRTINNMPKIYSQVHLPHRHRRTLNSGVNLNLGASSSFDNKGKLGSNIIRNRKLAMPKTQNRYYLGRTREYPQALRSENLNAAANLKTAYGAKFNNEGGIGSNLLYSARRRSTNDPSQVHSETYSSQYHRRTLNSGANLNLGPSSTFENKGKIGSNIIRNRIPAILKTQNRYYPRMASRNPQLLRSENLNAAANLNTAYGAKFENVGHIGSNLLYSAKRRSMSGPNQLHSGTYPSKYHRRTLNSAANLNLGPSSTFENKGKIGSNIMRNRIRAMLKTQNHYYSGMASRNTHLLRSDNLNAAANLNTAYKAKFDNEGEIGSNLLYNANRGSTNDPSQVHSETYFSQHHRRNLNSGANLNLGPSSTFENKGKVGSNVIQNRKAAVLKTQNRYYPGMALRFPQVLRSENLNAATNLNTELGTKFYNGGAVGSNVLYTTMKSINNINKAHFPQHQRRSMNSAANLNLGPSSAFGNRGKIGSNIISNWKSPMLEAKNRYYVANPQVYPIRNLKAAANTNTALGVKFDKEGQIGSNLLYNTARRSPNNNYKMHSETYLPQHHLRTTSSSVNLNLGPSSTFGNRGKIGSNVIANWKPGKNRHHSEAPLRYDSHLGSQKLNAAVNINTAYGTKFDNEGKIGSNLLYGVRKWRTNNDARIFSRRNPHHRRSTMNSAGNLDFRPLTTFNNRDKIGSNIIRNRKPVILKLHSRANHGIDFHYPPELRSKNSNAKANLISGYGTAFNNKGEKVSNLQNDASITRNSPRVILYSRTYFPRYHRRSNISARNLNFGTQSTLESSVLPNKSPAMFKEPNNLRHPPKSTSENMDSAAGLAFSYGSVGSTGSTLIRDRESVISLRLLPQNYPEIIKSSANLNFEPGSYFSNKGDVGSSIVHEGDSSLIKQRGRVSTTPRKPFVNTNKKQVNFPKDHRVIYNMPAYGSYLNRADSVNNFHGNPKIDTRDEGNAFTFVDAYENSNPRFHYVTSANNYKTNIYSGKRARNIQSGANLKLGSSARVRNVGTIGSTFVQKYNGVRRDIAPKPDQSFVSHSRNKPLGARVHTKTQTRIPRPYGYYTRASRTDEKDANKKDNKGKGIVSIFMGSGTLFENTGSIANDKYEVYASPNRTKFPVYKPSVTSYAYVIPPNGKGRSALSGGKVVTGISTNISGAQLSSRVSNNRINNRYLKPIYRKRSSLINDGTISANKVLFSRGSVIASNRSKTQMSNSSPAAVSFGQLGLDMTQSSNKASIVAGDNAQIIINGQMGTYQISIPIGSIVASEGGEVNLRIFSRFWSASGIGMRSSLNFLKHLNSVITGVVKITSMDSYGREKVVGCELENPITAVEIGRPLLSDKLLLHLLFVTKLRTNLANLLAYLTAINASKLDKRLYVFLQILYNAVQYRRINVLPLFILMRNLKVIPRKYHFKAMLELLQNVAPSNIRGIIKTLIGGFKKRIAKYISENLILLLTDTLDMDIIPGITAQQQVSVVFGDMDTFANQVVNKAFLKVKEVSSVRELKDVIYLTMLNLPMSYSVPQLPIKLRLVAQMLLMELTDEVWRCAAMKARHISFTNVYTGLKRFLSLLLECPKVPADIRGIVWDTVQILPDAMPRDDIFDLSITSFAPTAAKIIMGNNVIDNRAFNTDIEVTNSLGSVISNRG